MRTTLTIDDDVAARLEEARKKTGMSFKEIVDQTLRKGLERQQVSSRKLPRFVVKPRAMGKMAGLNYANIGELLEQLEGVDHR